MSDKVDATVEKGLDQAYARAHEDWLAQAQRENAGNGFLSEVTRLTFGAAASMQVQLAGGILSQRSAQAQPQQLPGPGGTGVPAGFKLVPV
jgi:hypothetical protein